MSILVLVALCLQWRVAAGLKFEIEHSQVTTNESERAASPDAGVPGAEEEKGRLRESSKDLLRLRNEARQLRQEAAELASLREKNDRLRKALAEAAPQQNPFRVPEGFIGKETLSDKGLTTPEAAAETFFWAMREGNVERIYDATTSAFEKPGNLEKMTLEQRQDLMARFADELRNQMKYFSSICFVGREEPTPDMAKLKLQSGQGGPTAEMLLRKVSGQWRVEKPF
ncbi:MAG TPA: hypothetical protein VMZ27_04070 [Candidatus Saccharimonadales bacterium]|nr:hypothetical protein [Candidatus Saccharimonadales bacterium]